MNDSIADIRKDYKLQKLNEADVSPDALVQFGSWWREAIDSAIDEVNAFTLATATPNGSPFARVVLLKGFDERGFVFFTNYNSNKGCQIARNANVAMVFFWKELERQVRVEGTAAKVSDEESDHYFSSRPEGSRIGAWSSPQSAVIASREVIEENEKRYRTAYPSGAVPRPDHWGGYRIKPFKMEYWQGRPSRLHDRLQYTLQESGEWKIERLAP